MKGLRFFMNDNIFKRLCEVVNTQQKIIESITKKLSMIESIGGGGSAIVEDYISGKEYERNTIVVDTETEDTYRVINKYTSMDIDTDRTNGNIIVLSVGSQIIRFNHNPTKEEVANVPKGSYVIVYNPQDPPYSPGD